MSIPSTRIDGRAPISQLDGIADWVERRAGGIAIAVAAATVLVCALRAAHMALWFDEILTLLIAKLPQVSDIPAACADNADGMPPAFYLAVRAMVLMGWSDALAVRLLCVAGYAVFTWCMFRFVSAEKPAVYGIVAMLLPSLTGCWFFATAGRPYGILLGCTGVAMVCWQSISRGNRRSWVAVLFPLALVTASAVHYLGFLLAFPFAIAETFRVIQGRKFDWRVVGALASPAAVLAIYAPIMVRAKTPDGSPLGKASVVVRRQRCSGDVRASRDAGPRGDSRRRLPDSTIEFQNREHRRRPSLPRGELILVLAILALPAVTLLLGRFATHNFVARYSIESMAGLSVVLTYSMRTLFLDRREPALLAALLMVAALGFSQLRHTGEIGSNAHQIPAQALASGLPIAVSHPFTFMAMRYYLEPALRKRLLYVASPEAALKFVGSNSDEYLMIRGRAISAPRWCRTRSSSGRTGILSLRRRRIPQLAACRS